MSDSATLQIVDAVLQIAVTDAVNVGDVVVRVCQMLTILAALLWLATKEILFTASEDPEFSSTLSKSKLDERGPPVIA